VIKPRSGITQQGDRFELQGNLDDLSFAFQSFNLSTSAEELTGSSKEKVLKVLSGRTEDTGMSVADVVATTGVTVKTAERILRQLYADRVNTKVERVKAKAATKSVYLYYRLT